jgi:hypothetical protein
MAETRWGIMELTRSRLRCRGLGAAREDELLQHIENFLRYHNRSEPVPTLVDRSADSDVDEYLHWLAKQPGQGAPEIAAARRAIELLYSDVFRIPISRS